MHPDVLNSWKEIAAYLAREERTVQRWELELNMPVRRPRGKSRSPVIAIKTELNEWLKTCGQQAKRRNCSAALTRSLTALDSNAVQMHTSCLEMLNRLQQTRALLQRARILALKRNLLKPIGPEQIGHVPAHPELNNSGSKPHDAAGIEFGTWTQTSGQC